MGHRKTMKYIKLTQNKRAMVDDEDFDYLNQWKWCISKRGNTFYARRGVRKGGANKSIRMHRQIMDAKNGQEIDHIDRNGLNNTKENLRFVTRSQNIRNTCLRKDNTSGCKGVSLRKKYSTWLSHIIIKNKLIHLGSFKNKNDAIKIRLEAEKILWN
jgi:hypothetical protein